MALLLFTPSSTIEANIFQYRLDQSPFFAEWNMRTGAYEFDIEEEELDDLEEIITNSIAFDINGYFECQD